MYKFASPFSLNLSKWKKQRLYLTLCSHTECKYQLQQMAMKQNSSVLSINTGFVIFSVLNVY